MRAEETFDPSKNGGRVTLVTARRQFKKDWNVVVLGSGKRGGVGNALRGINS